MDTSSIPGYNRFKNGIHKSFENELNNGCHMLAQLKSLITAKDSEILYRGKVIGVTCLYEWGSSDMGQILQTKLA